MMSLIAKAGGGEGFEPVPEGVTVGVCVSVYDLGTHYEEKWSKSQHKVVVMWEVPEHTYIGKDGVVRPRVVSRRYTLGLSDRSTLRHHLEGWRGKAFQDAELRDGFDISKLLGLPCQLQIVHRARAGKTSIAEVANVIAVPKGLPTPQPARAAELFVFDGTAAKGIPENTPGWVADLIRSSDEWRAEGEQAGGGEAAEAAPIGEDGEGLPF